MKIEMTIKQEYDIKVLFAEIGVRYWEDGTVNGVEDTEGNLIPCRNGDTWDLRIDVETGKILNWKQGYAASVHYKVCDNGEYTIFDHLDRPVKTINGYVPKCLCPKENGHGDYVIMDISIDGFIDGWDNSELAEAFDETEEY